MTETRWCDHCDAEEAAYRSGLCRPCAAYLRKMDALPSSDVLIRRQERLDDKRQQRAAAPTVWAGAT